MRNTRFTAQNDNPDMRFHSTNKSNPTSADNTPKIGVLLTNLGTPDAPTAPALRRYLAEFLSDPRVVEIPRVLWLMILHGIILRVRPKKSAALYRQVWTEEGSPLLVIAKKQQAAVQRQLGDGYSVKLGMRYGNPSIQLALRELQQEAVRKIIVLPLYPQYAGPTTGSTFDAVARELKNWRWVPELHFINSYCDRPEYITALSNSIREHIEAKGMPQKILFSYHGMPQCFLTAGDPYFCFCQKTTRLVQERLGLDKNQIISTFQSRFGKAEWLKPYTDETLKNLAQEGCKHIAIVSPAFSADCLETLEELMVENKHTFLQAGGETYDYIAALNDREDHIAALTSVIKGA